MKTTLTSWRPAKLPLLLLLWALAVGGIVSPAHAQSATGRKVILGVFVGNEPADLAQFNNWLGKPADAVLAYTGERDWSDASPNWILGQFGSSGSELLWSVRMFPNGSNNGLNNMREAASGARNSMYQDWARTILNSRSGDSRPIYVRTAWELGGDWFYWTRAAKADPAAFIAAWRNFAQAFYSVSPRFKLVWDFVPDKMGYFGPPENYYPGDEVVDVIAQDVYWHPQWETNDPDQAFDYDLNYERGLNWMTTFATQHGKPMAIPEWGAPGGPHYERDQNGNSVLVWNGDNLNGARYIERMKQWIETHDVVFATYWNSDADYTGKLSDGAPAATATALKNLYLNGVTSGGSVTPPPASTIQSGAVYELTPQHATGTRLTAGAGTGNGAQVSIAAANGSLAQAWQITQASGDIYELTPQLAGASSQRLDVNGARNANSTKVQLWQSNRTPAQQWKIITVDAANGVYELEPQCAVGQRLDVAGAATTSGTVVQTYQGNSTNAQRWKLTLKTVPTGIVSGGVYELAPQHATGNRLNATGTGNEAQITVATANGSLAQAWQLTNVSGDIYELTPQLAGATGQRLDVAGAKSTDGGKVQLYATNATPAQRWRLVAIDAANSIYELEPQCGTGTRQRLDVAGNSQTSGAIVHTWGSHSGDNQRWKLTLRSATVSGQQNGLAASRPAAQLLVYPNPATEQATLKYTLDAPAAVRLEVLDWRGQRTALLLDNVTQPAGPHTAVLPVSTLQAGTYRVVLTSNKTRKVLSLEVR
ncbi:RICIN domain-containing protein [Hymenobacter weizhouensis]|uniref:RICIN domain-containing protein n=1 Tax=Hymenobacter sp. YIM 151500-1 TaxID=2987689 RepID=UPI002227ABAD|nr:RICIN domain-containing protein [Hymenobacter sp. YIM 151500-1]UYZ62936.1 RICIN domain-containing protein [Hymenobacter sp. YIM 151500-1]